MTNCSAVQGGTSLLRINHNHFSKISCQNTSSIKTLIIYEYKMVCHGIVMQACRDKQTPKFATTAILRSMWLSG